MNPSSLIRPLLRPAAPLVLAACALLTTSCMENSTVIRVRRDGSGEIFARYHFSPQMTGMLGMMAGLAAGAGNPAPTGDQAPGKPAAAPQIPTADSLLKPSQESLVQGAAAYGKGVRFVRQEPGKNAAGWDGYLVVYQFDDISQLAFDPNNPPGPLGDLAKMSPEATAEIEKQTAGKQGGATFAMADGLLTVHTGMSPDAISQIGEGAGGLGGGAGLPGGGQITGPNGAAIDPAAAMQMAAGMFQGMRIAYFIRVDGEIAETNAKHVDGTLITMTDMQPGKMMADPKFAALMAEGEKLQSQQPTPEQVDTLMKQVEALDGVTLETQETVTVRFK